MGACVHTTKCNILHLMNHSRGSDEAKGAWLLYYYYIYMYIFIYIYDIKHNGVYNIIYTMYIYAMPFNMHDWHLVHLNSRSS